MADKFSGFFKEFGHFLKEGLSATTRTAIALAKLLRYESLAVGNTGRVCRLRFADAGGPEGDLLYLRAKSRSVSGEPVL